METLNDVLIWVAATAVLMTLLIIAFSRIEDYVEKKRKQSKK